MMKLKDKLMIEFGQFEAKGLSFFFLLEEFYGEIDFDDIEKDEEELAEERRIELDRCTFGGNDLEEAVNFEKKPEDSDFERESTLGFKLGESKDPNINEDSFQPDLDSYKSPENFEIGGPGFGVSEIKGDSTHWKGEISSDNLDKVEEIEMNENDSNDKSGLLKFNMDFD